MLKSLKILEKINHMSDEYIYPKTCFDDYHDQWLGNFNYNI